MSNMAVGRVVTVGWRRRRDLAYNRFGDFLLTLARNFSARAVFILERENQVSGGSPSAIAAGKKGDRNETVELRPNSLAVPSIGLRGRMRQRFVRGIGVSAAVRVNFYDGHRRVLA